MVGGLTMITISWHFLVFIVIIAGLWIFTFTLDDYEEYFTYKDLGIIISIILTIILFLVYGGIFWW